MLEPEKTREQLILELEHSRGRAEEERKKLRERVKELECFYRIGELAERPGIDSGELFKGIVELLPQSFLYQDIAGAALCVDGKTYSTARYDPHGVLLQAGPFIEGSGVTSLEVSYPAAGLKPGMDPFLDEERRLMRAVAERVGHMSMRLKAQAALRESDVVLNNVPAAIAYVSVPELRYLMCNRTFAELFSLRQDEIEDKTVMEVLGEGAFARARPYIEKAAGGERVIYENLIPVKGGTLWFDISYIPETGEGGAVRRLIVIAHDITDRRRAEEELTRMNATLEQRVAAAADEIREKERLLTAQSRLAAMGEMVDSIAHQWRQPLNLIGLLVQNMADGRRDPGEIRDRVMSLVRHMSATVDDFRNFLRPDREKKAFSLEASIRQAAALASPGFTDNDVLLDLDLKEDCMVTGYPNEFGQALLNILFNALEALTERKVPHPRVRIGLERGGRTCAVTVADNAGGIGETAMGRIFEPYFTTRENGTGLGLYMSKVIIEKNMGGKLTARNAAGGAEFRIEL